MAKSAKEKVVEFYHKARRRRLVYRDGRYALFSTKSCYNEGARVVAVKRTTNAQACVYEARRLKQWPEFLTWRFVTGSKVHKVRDEIYAFLQDKCITPANPRDPLVYTFEARQCFAAAALDAERLWPDLPREDNVRHGDLVKTPELYAMLKLGE